jgi:HSP20 family protein
MVTRWNPVNEMLALRDTMDRMFDTAFRPYWSGGATTWQQGLSFPLNIYERDDSLYVEAVLPGISPEDVNVSVDNGVLTIGATRHGVQPEDKDQTANWYLHEIVPGQFKRSLTLPFAVDTEKSSANYTNGLLTLTLPKAETARPKRIQIGGAPAEIEAHKK